MFISCFFHVFFSCFFSIYFLFLGIALYKIGFIDKEYLLSILIIGIELNPLKTDVLCTENRNQNSCSSRIKNNRKRTRKNNTVKKSIHTFPESEEWVLPAHLLG